MLLLPSKESSILPLYQKCLLVPMSRCHPSEGPAMCLSSLSSWAPGKSPGTFRPSAIVAGRLLKAECPNYMKLNAALNNKHCWQESYPSVIRLLPPYEETTNWCLLQRPSRPALRKHACPAIPQVSHGLLVPQHTPPRHGRALHLAQAPSWPDTAFSYWAYPLHAVLGELKQPRLCAAVS